MRFSAIFTILCFVNIDAHHTSSCGVYQTYDICQDPVHNGTYFTPLLSRECNTTRVRPLLRDARRTTLDQISYINTLVEEFAHEHRISDDTETNNSVIPIFEHATQYDISEENTTTKVYLKMAGLIRVQQLLKCQLNETLRRCHCLKFPDHIFNRIKKRLVGKWYIIQDACGKNIEDSQCNIRTQLPFEERITCEDLRDVIYNFLHHALNVLRESHTAFHGHRLLSA